MLRAATTFISRCYSSLNFSHVICHGYSPPLTEFVECHGIGPWQSCRQRCPEEYRETDGLVVNNSAHRDGDIPKGRYGLAHDERSKKFDGCRQTSVCKQCSRSRRCYVNLSRANIQSIADP